MAAAVAPWEWERAPIGEEGRAFDRFTRAFIRQTKGRWNDQPLALEPWQLAWVAELLRGRFKQQGVYREALLGLPRKNGKSTLAAALALYALVVESALFEPGAEVYAAAASRDQARIVFGQATEFVRRSPRLTDWVKPYRNAIEVTSTGAVFRVLSSDAGLQHGLNPSFVVVDELHAHRDGGDLYFALRTAGLARVQPLLVSITTAGYDLETILGEIYLRGLEGNDPTLFFNWLGVTDEELDDHAAWKRANPASWITEDDLVRESRSLPPSQFQMLHLNRWTATEELWLPAGAWEMCEGTVRIEEGDSSYVACDVGLKHDTTGTVHVVPVYDRPDGLPSYHVRARAWGVHPDPDKPEPPAHDIVAGDEVDFDPVENHFRDLAKLYDVRALRYDPYKFWRSARVLENEGIAVEEFPQSNERMCPASQLLYDLIIEGRIVHDGDPILRRQIEAATARDTGRGWRLDKKKSRAPMDLAVALAMAVAAAAEEENRGRPSFTVV
jgi:phage terminase large subunit-like protein